MRACSPIIVGRPCMALSVSSPGNGIGAPKVVALFGALIMFRRTSPLGLFWSNRYGSVAHSPYALGKGVGLSIPSVRSFGPAPHDPVSIQACSSVNCALVTAGLSFNLVQDCILVDGGRGENTNVKNGVVSRRRSCMYGVVERNAVLMMDRFTAVTSDVEVSRS